MQAGTLDPTEERALDAWWRASNYLAVGQIYLLDNPLLAEPLRVEHLKPRLVGHWGTTPGLNLIYAHVNRVIRARDLNAIVVLGPGHGGPAAVANAWLDGRWSEVRPGDTQDAAGMKRLFRAFSFPGGVGSHATPEIPGSMHEGGELGYSLAHAYGAAFDQPDLVVFCVVGDGEAETGPLAGSWHANKFVDPVGDGAVVPILHLNGYKIANPTVLDRIPRAELEALCRGYGHRPLFVDCDDPARVHALLARAMDEALDDVARIQREARGASEGGAGGGGATPARPVWPMIVLRTPKGWTGPKEVDGKHVEGTFRAHQVPLDGVRENAAHRAMLEAWLRSYRPEELFDAQGRPTELVRSLAPKGTRRTSANPVADGGGAYRALELPDARAHAVDVPAPGATTAEATRALGKYLREVVRANPQRFRIFGPDETVSNRLGDVFDVTERQFAGEIRTDDEHLAPRGRVVEILSEHLCQGWLEGYVLTGRHGVFDCYEAFVHIVDSMFNQHAKWLKVAKETGWRTELPSFNYLLSSHVWRQDHNGFSHQDPGFIDHVVNKKADIVRVYLPPDANTLLATADHCLRSRHTVNVIVAGKQSQANWLDFDAAARHFERGADRWDWAGREPRGSKSDDGPDVVLACCGDVPTLETLAAVALLREHLPALSVRVVNVVDLMRLQPEREHPHGMTDAEFDALFTKDRPILFAFHGYPWLIHRLAYRRTNHDNLHVRGYKEEGTVTTPFDMVMLNDLDRYRLVLDVIARVPGLAARPEAEEAKRRVESARAAAHAHTRAHGEDPPEVRDWKWT